MQRQATGMHRRAKGADRHASRRTFLGGVAAGLSAPLLAEPAAARGDGPLPPAVARIRLSVRGGDGSRDGIAAWRVELRGAEVEPVDPSLPESAGQLLRRVVLIDGRPVGTPLLDAPTGDAPTGDASDAAESIGAPLMIDVAADEPLGLAPVAGEPGLVERLEQLAAARGIATQGAARRIDAYEEAFRLQTVVRDAVRLTEESAATRRRYGLDRPASRALGRRLLVARRLLERGCHDVRVEYEMRQGPASLPYLPQQLARPLGGLLADLQRRGYLATMG